MCKGFRFPVYLGNDFNAVAAIILAVNSESIE
jgi:xanthine/uracil permease